MDQVLLARLQFAITSVYHFFFVPLTLGLSILVALMETRYVRTGNEIYKRALVDAGEKSTVYTNCFNLEWEAMHRVLRNSTFLAWEAEGCPLAGSKPLEDDIIAVNYDGSEVMRYSGGGYGAKDGQLEAVAMYAGQGVGTISDLPNAADLVERLWSEVKGYK